MSLEEGWAGCWALMSAQGLASTLVLMSVDASVQASVDRSGPATAVKMAQASVRALALPWVPALGPVSGMLKAEALVQSLAVPWVGTLVRWLAVPWAKALVRA